MALETPPLSSLHGRTTFARATLAVVAAGLLWRVARYAVNMPLWGDEAYLAVTLITRDLAGLVRPLEYFQIAPVGFLWAERLAIGWLGASEWALRLWPFLAGVGALLLFWRFASENLDRRSTLMAVAIFAASFYPIRHATEVKPYAIDLFLALLATWLARAVWRAPDSARAWIALTVAAALGVWASYPLIFVVAGVGLVLAHRVWTARPRGNPIDRRGMGFCALYGGATLASWAVMYLAIGRPQALAAPFLTQMQTWESSFPPILRPWALPWWIVTTHAGNMAAYPYGGNNFGSLATTTLALIGAWALWRRDRGLLALLIAPLGPAFVAAALHRYPYGTSARISLFAAPAICLLAGRGLAALIALRLPRGLARRTLLGVAAGLGLVAVVGAGYCVVVPYKDHVDRNYRRIVESLARETQAGDRWIGFNGMVELPKVKQLMLMPWLQHAAQFHFYALRDAPVPIAWMPAQRDLAPATSGRTWFLVHTFGYDKFPEALLQEHLDRLIAARGAPKLLLFEPKLGERVQAFVFDAPAP